MSKAMQKHLAAIEGGLVNQTNVIGIRKALNSYWRAERGYSYSDTNPPMTRDEYNRLFPLLREKAPIVEGRLHETGVKLLQSKRYKSRLKDVAHIVSNLTMFRLVDFNISYQDGTATPVFKAFNSKGEGFKYICRPWQSGGNGPEILES